jgi:hypothetical protein
MMRNMRGESTSVRVAKIPGNSDRRALNRLGDGFRISEVILLSLRIGTYVFRRHQAGVVAKHLELATEMMRPDAGLHANQTGRHIREPCFHLATRPLLPQDNLPARVLTDNVEGVFTDIDTNNGSSSIDLLGHDVLLVFGAPCQLPSLAGREHGRTIPLADIYSFPKPAHLLILDASAREVRCQHRVYVVRWIGHDDQHILIAVMACNFHSGGFHEAP